MTTLTNLFIRLLAGLVAAWCAVATAQVPPPAGPTRVSPNGAVVRSTGPTTVFLTFHNLAANERSVAAFWCGAVTAGLTGGSESATNPCLAGTIYGSLPLRNDQSRMSASGTQRNLTDIMTIPATVARRAYQDAQAGQQADFFYVRQFSGGAADRFVIVTCLMGGGGATSPLSLLDVRVAFQTANGDAPILALARGDAVPRFGATVTYNGSGNLKGRWEVALPGDPEPTDQDLLTEATLPIEQRAQQRRYTLIERFDLFLTSDGRIYVSGPDPRRMPVQVDGPYKVLLRIEASDDKIGDSNIGGGRTVNSGGAAGFPMPFLRYFVGTPDSLASLRQSAQPSARSKGVTLMLPEDGAKFTAGRRVQVSWLDGTNVALYQVEFAADNKVVFTAMVKPGVSQYEAPPFLRERPEKNLSWRVVSLGRGGEVIGTSDFRTMQFE